MRGVATYAAGIDRQRIAMNSLRAARYPKCIATVCLSGTLPEKLEAAAAAGFDGIEIFENDLLNFDGSPDRVRQMAADLGLAIMLYQPFRDFEAMPRELFARNLARAERKFDVMAELGVETVLVSSAQQTICARWRKLRPGVGCVWATRRWHGGGTREPGGKRGKSCSRLTTRRSG
jgi:4-hydroxyphenylpyruvate dioxygenase